MISALLLILKQTPEPGQMIKRSLEVVLRFEVYADQYGSPFCLPNWATFKEMSGHRGRQRLVVCAHAT